MIFFQELSGLKSSTSIISKSGVIFETDAIIRNILQNNKNDYENVKSAFEQVGKKYTTLNLVLANNKTKEVML